MLDTVPAEVFDYILQHIYPYTFYSLMLTSSLIFDKIHHPRSWKIIYTAYIRFKKHELLVSKKCSIRKMRSYEKALKTIPTVRKPVSFRAYLKQTIIEHYHRKLIVSDDMSFEQIFAKIEDAANTLVETEKQRIPLRKLIGTYNFNIFNRYLGALRHDFDQEQVAQQIELIVSRYQARNNEPHINHIVDPNLIRIVVTQLAKNKCGGFIPLLHHLPYDTISHLLESGYIDTYHIKRLGSHLHVILARGDFRLAEKVLRYIPLTGGCIINACESGMNFTPQIVEFFRERELYRFNSQYTLLAIFLRFVNIYDQHFDEMFRKLAQKSSDTDYIYFYALENRNPLELIERLRGDASVTWFGETLSERISKLQVQNANEIKSYLGIK